MIAYCYLSNSYRIDSADDLLEYKTYFEEMALPVLQAANDVCLLFN